MLVKMVIEIQETELVNFKHGEVVLYDEFCKEIARHCFDKNEYEKCMRGLNLNVHYGKVTLCDDWFEHKEKRCSFIYTDELLHEIERIKNNDYDYYFTISFAYDWCKKYRV